MKTAIKKIIRFILLAVFTFICFSVSVVLLFKWFDPPITAFIQSKSTANLFASLNDYNYEWKSIDKISPFFSLAVIAAEDQKFFDHNGFDFQQIEKAIEEIEEGRRVRGASTITQQVAKNLFLWETKSFLRKGIESYYTILLELIWSKKRILEVYINIVELGENIYGIESASQLLLSKSSERLTIREAALAASVLPKPSARNLSQPSNYMMKRSESIIQHMNNLGGAEFLKTNL
jgi:monofunctional biosynthetic peptidoglycan transglycosylase